MISMRPVANFWSMVGPRSLLMPYGVAARQKAIAAYSTVNAGCLPELEAIVERATGGATCGNWRCARLRMQEITARELK